MEINDETLKRLAVNSRLWQQSRASQGSFHFYAKSVPDAKVTEVLERERLYLEDLKENGQVYRKLCLDPLNEAKRNRTLARTFASAGAVLIFLAVIFFLTGNIPIGIPTGAASIIPGAVSGLFFNNVKESNKRVDSARQEIEAERLKSTERVMTFRHGMQACDEISNQVVRDQCYKKLSEVITKPYPPSKVPGGFP